MLGDVRRRSVGHVIAHLTDEKPSATCAGPALAVGVGIAGAGSYRRGTYMVGDG